MANIQPFDYQKSTNIEEHNQIVNKVNEIVEVINNVNLDTINTEIANLKANATATDTEIANIKNKDTTQDTEINGITKSLVSNVTATFDNPSRQLKISLGREASPSIDATVVIPASSETGQYSAGNGITIENYQIAVDTGVVALKTDIPVVPDVSEITTRLDTIDGEITGINTDITNITNKNTEQDTAINGKVAISQGIENAGKVLGIGSDGNVTPVVAGGSSGGGEVWEELDLNNWPTDWVVGDRIRIKHDRVGIVNNNATSWTSDSQFNFSMIVSGALSSANPITEHEITNGTDNYLNNVVNINYVSNKQIAITFINSIGSVDQLNSKTLLIAYGAIAFNGASMNDVTIGFTPNNIGGNTKIWRLKKST